MSDIIKLAVSGCRGRMGQSITQLAQESPKVFHLTAFLENKDHPQAKGDINGIPISTDNSALKGADVLIEFTLPDATIENLKACVTHNVKMVIGTTGLTESQVAEIKKASQKIPIVFASNMSIGVNVLFKTAETVAKKLVDIQKITVYEEHHQHKKDKPSGTAKTLAEIIEKACGHSVHMQEPKREGEIIGNHEVTFETPFDTFTISHSAKTRAMFAKGALDAAVFLKDKKSGLFNMQNVLGLD